MFTYCIYRNSSIYIKVHLFYIYNVAAYQIWIESCSTQQPGHLLKIARKSLFIVLHYLKSTCSLHKMGELIQNREVRRLHWGEGGVNDFQNVALYRPGRPLGDFFSWKLLMISNGWPLVIGSRAFKCPSWSSNIQ